MFLDCAKCAQCVLIVQERVHKLVSDNEALEAEVKKNKQLVLHMESEKASLKAKTMKAEETSQRLTAENEVLIGPAPEYIL